MYIASAPTDMSALSMTVVAVVMALCLAAWIGLVFLADRPPRGRARARLEVRHTEAEEHLPAKRGDIAA